MFFIFSKLAALLFKPLTWTVALALAAVFTKPSRRQRRLTRLTAALLVLFSNLGLISALAGWWETGHRSPDSIDTPYDYAIVLGGYIDTEAAGPADLITLHRSGNRLTAALELYHTGKARRVLLTGGDGRLVGAARPEAYTAREWLLEAGVPDSAIVVEPRSRNTRENAVFTKNLLDSLSSPFGARAAGPVGRGGEEGARAYVLITSAWHMRRAEGCFRRAGLSVAPLAADFLAERHNGNPWRWLEPSWEAWMKWEMLLKEWVGYGVYAVRGWV